VTVISGYLLFSRSEKWESNIEPISEVLRDFELNLGTPARQPNRESTVSF